MFGACWFPRREKKRNGKRTTKESMGISMLRIGDVHCVMVKWRVWFFRAETTARAYPAMSLDLRSFGHQATQWLTGRCPMKHKSHSSFLFTSLPWSETVTARFWLWMTRVTIMCYRKTLICSIMKRRRSILPIPWQIDRTNDRQVEFASCESCESN